MKTITKEDILNFLNELSDFKLKVEAVKKNPNIIKNEFDFIHQDNFIIIDYTNIFLKSKIFYKFVIDLSNLKCVFSQTSDKYIEHNFEETYQIESLSSFIYWNLIGEIE